jgi:hypothetical protein
MNERQRCETCKYWVAPDDDEGHFTEGICRRYPPGRRQIDEFITEPAFATTYARAWCGEWQAANPETVDEAATVMARAVLAGDATAGRALADRLQELVPLPLVDPGPTARP